MTKSNIALLGVGTVYEVHKNAILNTEGLSLRALCDIDKSKLEQERNRLIEKGLDVNCYTNINDLLLDSNIDSVHVLLPHFEHLEACEKVIKSNKRLFCEKPLSCNSIAGQSFINRFNLDKQQSCLCLQNRFNNSVRLAKKIINSGELGKLVSVSAQVLWYRSSDYYKVAPWRASFLKAGGGTMINQSIHTIDLLSYLLGPIRSVRGHIYNLASYDIEVEDSASVCFEYFSGVKGYFHSTVVNSSNDSVKIFMHFEDAELRIEDYRLILIKDNKFEVLIEDEKMSACKSYYGSSHLRLIRRFYGIENDLMFEGEDLFPRLVDGLASLKFIDAVRESSKSNKLVMLDY